MKPYDDKLRALLKEKYNVVLDGVDCIEMCHMQLVINTVREFDANPPQEESGFTSADLIDSMHRSS